MADSLPIQFIGCKVLEGLVEARLKSQNGLPFHYFDWQHDYPKQLNQSIQEEINKIQTPSLVVLIYGLCGNALDLIEARQHTLVIPKADDCITLFMGSQEKYFQEFNTNPATFYLTKGWIEVGGDPLSEYQVFLERYEEKKAARIMDLQYKHYKRLVFVANDPQDFDEYRTRNQAIAAFCQQWGMVYEEHLGNDTFFNQIAALAENPSEIPKEFLVIPPGGKITQEMFRKGSKDPRQ